MKVKFPVPKGLTNQYIAGTAACLSVLASGSCYGWITPILNHLLGPNSEIPMTNTQAGIIVSIIELGNLLSPLPAGILTNYVGRKPVILTAGPLYIISWLMIIYYPTLLMLGVVRVLQGIAMGLAFTAVPVYLGEIASDSTRGVITSIFFNSWWLGFLVEFAAGPFLSFTNFTWFTLMLNVPFVLFFCWQPETPYYYCMAGDEEKAYESLKWFRDTTEEQLKEELQNIKWSVKESSKTASLRELVATPTDRRALGLLMVLTAVRISSGTGSLLVYATQIFDLTPNLTISSDMITVAMGIVMFIGGLLSSFTTDTLGRRPVLLTSCVGSLICQFFIGTYYYLLFDTSIPVSNFSWVAPMFILVYSCLCTAGMYPVCIAFTSELFNSNMRGVAASLGSINVTIFSFLMLVMFQPVTDSLGLYANFYIYTVIVLCGSLYFYLYAPETKGKSFVEIRKYLCKTKVNTSTMVHREGLDSI